MKKKLNNQGFTLIEVVIVVMLVVVCGYIAADLFINQNRLYNVQTAELNIAGDARVALDDVDNYVRVATRVLDTYTTYTGGSQVLILQIQSVNSSNQLIAATFDNVVYYLDSGGFYREIFPDVLSSRTAGIKKLASNVNSLNFTYNNASFPLVTDVSTSITIQEDGGVQTRSITLSSKAILRNY